MPHLQAARPVASHTTNAQVRTSNPQIGVKRKLHPRLVQFKAAIGKRRLISTYTKAYAKLTCSACNPLGPRFTTNVTRAPSSNVR